MHILITGGAGLLGSKLARQLLERGSLELDGTRREIISLTLFDRAEPNSGESFLEDSRLKVVSGDLTNAETIRSLLKAAPDVIFHLAAVVSGEAEKNFELGMAVNIDATRTLLETCRASGTTPHFVFTSSVAVYGGELPDVIQDDTALNPQSSYGMQKAVGELLVNDYSRRGFIDGRVLRLPTVVVRPGQPNAATSSFASSIIREPLQGAQAVCPVSAETRMWIMSPRQAVESLIHAAQLRADDLGTNRSLALPGLSVSVGEMVSELAEVAGQEVAGRVRWETDPFIERIVGSWPAQFAPRRASKLGFKADKSLRDLIEIFIQDDMQGPLKVEA